VVTTHIEVTDMTQKISTLLDSGAGAPGDDGRYRQARDAGATDAAQVKRGVFVGIRAATTATPWVVGPNGPKD
jgi:hypothetical protein